MSIDSIIILASLSTGLIGVYNALSNKIVALETKVQHLEDELEKENKERKADLAKIEGFHKEQGKAWHDLALSIERLNGVLQALIKENKAKKVNS